MRPYLFYCGDLCNLGDLALLLQNLEHLPAGRRAYVRRWAPLPETIVAQVAAAGGVLIDGRRIPSFVYLASRCDIIIGGGQLVRDNVSLPSLIAQYLGARAAVWRGGRVTTRGLGVSAIRERKRRWLWRALLRLTDAVRVRDARSATRAAALVEASHVVRTADMAFLPSRLHTAAQSDGVRDRILIAPCVDAGEERAIAEDLVSSIMTAARMALPDEALVFVCHDPRPGMDGAAARALSAAPGLAGARLVETYDLVALLGEYRSASLVVTNRLHALIFALLAGAAMVVIDDGNAKTRFVAEQFGVPVIAAGEGAEAAIAQALGFAADRRREVLAELAMAAKGNLT